MKLTVQDLIDIVNRTGALLDEAEVVLHPPFYFSHEGEMEGELVVADYNRAEIVLTMRKGKT